MLDELNNAGTTLILFIVLVAIGTVIFNLVIKSEN